jgi:phosphoenolpyruvate carboxylase
VRYRKDKAAIIMPTRRKTAPKKTARYWSADITQNSRALVLDPDVFTFTDPKRIAASLKRSAQKSHNRKSEPYRSAMSMLTFYINRAGRNLSAARKKVLQAAKDELRKQFGRE